MLFAKWLPARCILPGTTEGPRGPASSPDRGWSAFCFCTVSGGCAGQHGKVSLCTSLVTSAVGFLSCVYSPLMGLFGQLYKLYKSFAWFLKFSHLFSCWVVRVHFVLWISALDQMWCFADFFIMCASCISVKPA